MGCSKRRSHLLGCARGKLTGSELEGSLDNVSSVGYNATNLIILQNVIFSNPGICPTDAFAGRQTTHQNKEMGNTDTLETKLT